MPAPAPAARATAAAPTEAVSDAALIKQIASEARSSGKSLTFDPDTGTDADADDPPSPSLTAPRKGKEAKPGKSPRGKDGKFLKSKAEKEEADTDGDAENDPTETADTDGDGDEDAPEDDDAEDDEDDEEKPPPGALDEDAIRAALDAEGGVDMLALAKALGKEPEELGISPAQHKAIRLERRKAEKTLGRAQELADKLQKQFGDRVAARKAVATGDLQPAIACVEAIFDMTWNELNRAVAATLEGKPLPDIEEKRELRELKKKEEERKAAEKKAAEERATTERTEKAKAFITQKIKGDKLASPEFGKLLKDAGLPSITDLVFEELKAGFSKGLTDPRKALERVRSRLTKQAKALAAGGLVAVAAPKKTAAVTASKPRSSAQTGAASNSREMTDAELRRAVLKEAGLAR